MTESSEVRPHRDSLFAAVVTAPVMLAGVVPGPSSAWGATPGFPADPTTLVNTSIGNNGAGATFPGAALPFGRVLLLINREDLAVSGRVR